jgi:quercetin dioxygenase-like cupin family protein
MNNPVLAISTTLIDNDQVRVTRFDFAPGAHTGWHRHEHDYVITAITQLNMRLEEPDETEREVTVVAGEAYFRNVGVEHNVINMGSAPMSFIEVELK